MKTYSPKPEHIERHWYVVDASEQVLGRLASEVAALLRGKHKPIFAPHMDTGDHVIVVNADKVVLTGGKEMKKVAYRHSGYPGGITGTRYDRLLREKPVFAVEKAIRGMLPKNRLGRSMVSKLHVLAGPDHPHAPQKPVAYTMGKPPRWEGLPAPKVRMDAGATQEKAGSKTPERASSGPAKKPTARKTAAKKPTAKKPTARKPATARTTGQKTTPKKTTAQKTTGKKTTARKTTATKPTARKTDPET
jgi:large subunit ribosomal protein L13